MTTLFEKLIDIIHKMKNAITVADIIRDVEFIMYDDGSYEVEGREFYSYKNALATAYLIKILKKI